MTGRGRDEHGFTLVELLAAMALFIVILGATLTTWEGFQRNDLRAKAQEVAADGARTTIDRLARDLRNHATPTVTVPEAIEKAEAQDIVLVTVGATKPAGSLNEHNLRRVRYCLDPAGRKLFMQVQTWTTQAAPAAPPSGACPETTGWTRTEILADDVANGARPAFTFAPLGWTDPNQIRTVGASVWVDADPAQRPRETQLQSAVELRNQNRPPVAEFTAQPVGNGHVLLSAGTSYDPEGHQLEYVWLDGGADVTDAPGFECPRAPTCDLRTTVGPHTFSLKVIDPSGLETTSPTQVVTVK